MSLSEELKEFEEKQLPKLRTAFVILIAVIYLAVFFWMFHTSNERMEQQFQIRAAAAAEVGEWKFASLGLKVPSETEVNAYSLTNFPSNGLKIVTLAIEKGSVVRIAVSDKSFSAISRGKFYPSNCKNGCILLLPNDNELLFVEGIHTGEFKPSMYKDLTFIRGAEVLKVDN